MPAGDHLTHTPRLHHKHKTPKTISQIGTKTFARPLFFIGRSNQRPELLRRSVEFKRNERCSGSFVDDERPASLGSVAVAFGAVCISRQNGAGAEETSRLVSATLGFRLIDEDIVTLAAMEAGVTKDVVADVERRKSSLIRLLEGIGPASMSAGAVAVLPEGAGYDQPAANELRGLIRSAIEETARTGNVIIVAHAASFALATRDDVLRVLLTASLPTRQRRLAALLEVDEKEAAREIKRSDAGRADYIKRFYGIGAEQPTHYDLVINTDKLTPDDAARLIADAVHGGS